MFKSIIENWGKAEGDLLKKDFLTAVENLDAGYGNSNWAKKVLAGLHEDINSEYGEFNSIAEATKHKLSKKLISSSKKLYRESDAENDRLGIGQAYALMMYGNWLEASITPGESAEFVARSMRTIIDDCIKNA